jgi:hypothetical protein
MNKAVTKRIISKQEAVVLLGDLDLTYCTEIIQNISISNSKAISAGDSNQTSSSTKTFIKEYKDRTDDYQHFTLHEYFHVTRNSKEASNAKLIIPHFVGINGTPKYPVTDSYARHTLIVHRPWREYPNKDIAWRDEFDCFINSSDCPLSAKMSYLRVMRRYIDKMTHYEPKAQDGDHSQNTVSADDEELMLLVGLKNGDEYDADDALFKSMERGLDHDWSRPPQVFIRVFVGCILRGHP